MVHLRVSLCLLALAASVLMVSPARAIVSSNTGTDSFSGLDISQVIGADAFYLQGYTGSRTIIANIEAGVAWSGHESLDEGQLTQFFSKPTTESSPGWNATPNTWIDRHATWTAQTMVGQGSFAYQQGIAYGSKLWSGAVATTWASEGTGNYSGSFNMSNISFASPYNQAMVTGVHSQGTADVINSSFAGGSGGDGNNFYSRMLDGLDFASGQGAALAAKLVCVSAGNSGPNSNSIGYPADGFNALIVGATQTDTTAYNSVGTFSGRSPSSVYDPTLNGGAGSTLFNARNRVDILAPGTNLTLAAYGGATGGNTFGGGTYSANNQYYSNEAGTSFSSPIVAAGAALVIDAGKARFASNPKAIDARVLKAVLMNSATKLAGWDNGQTTTAGVVTTSTSLDPAQGAGQINLTAAFSQYTAGTTDVSGLLGGSVHAGGWDYGSVPAGTHNDYPLDQTLPGGSTFTITLSWFAHDIPTVGTTNNSTSSDFDAFDNLDLEVFENINGTLTLVAQSDSKYNSSEHLRFTLPDTGNYVFRVLDAGYNWNDIDGNGVDTTTDYGIAWNAAVPEPSTAGMALASIMLLLRRRRRNSNDNSIHNDETEANRTFSLRSVIRGFVI